MDWGKHISCQWIHAGGLGNKRIARETLHGFIVGSHSVKDRISYLGVSMGLRATAVAGTASVVLLANWRPVAASMRIKDSKSAFSAPSASFTYAAWLFVDLVGTWGDRSLSSEWPGLSESHKGLNSSGRLATLLMTLSTSTNPSFGQVYTHHLPVSNPNIA